MISMPDHALITPRQARAWRAFHTQYEALFPAAEREPIGVLAERSATGRYRVLGAWDIHGGLAGFAVLDRVADPAYALITFLGVVAPWRRHGVARGLVAALRSGLADERLFVEAAGPAIGLYQRLGFVPLALDYHVPRYQDASATQAMRLLTTPDTQGLYHNYLAAVITHMFRDGYGVANDDPRLTGQLARIPAKVTRLVAGEPGERYGASGESEA